MKRIAKLILTLVIFSCVLLPTLVACDKESSGGTSSGDRLVIYNWEDYIDSERNDDGKTLLDEFADYYKDKTGRSLEIVYTTFDTNETMMTKVLKGDANVDLICPSEYAIQKLMVAGCLLNHKDIKAEIQADLTKYDISLDAMSSLSEESGKWGNIDPDIMNAISDNFSQVQTKSGKVCDMTEYMVPYMCGTLGILYNTSVVTREELEEYGWGVLWNVQQNERLENKILMKDSVRDTYAAAIFYMYEYDSKHGTNFLPEKYKNYTVQQLIDCTDDEMVAAAEKVLTAQREHISGYEVDFGKDDMINEIVYADFAWSGDALWAIEEGGQNDDGEDMLDYYVPPIASNIWYDGWCIPTSVNNKLAAMMFIDYMCSPMSSVRNSVAIGYTSAADKNLLKANQDVLQYLIDCEYLENVDDESYFEDERRYPVIDESLGVMKDFGDRNDVVVNMWQRAKSGATVDVNLWYVILAIVGAIGLCLGVYFTVQALKRRPRKLKQ